MFRFWGVVLVLGVAAAVCGQIPYAQAEDGVNYAKQLESVFTRVADEIGPAVVSISTVHTQKFSRRG
ncbi:MAG: hypothetical protein Q8R05_03400, partial [Candidatus Omnitrophota bacterium]|nr:hypothetical protein [Candidatus Omnitrophota bacterium]